MKTIKYKGLSVINGKWIYGCYVEGWKHFPPAIMQAGINAIAMQVDPDTVCQFIKMHNGEELYEGDILSEPVEVDGEMQDSREVVFYSEKEAAYCVDISFKKDRSSLYLLHAYDLTNYKIIGNIHDPQKEESTEKQAV